LEEEITEADIKIPQSPHRTRAYNAPEISAYTATLSIPEEVTTHIRQVSWLMAVILVLLPIHLKSDSG
jgi:hypothetical protein